MHVGPVGGGVPDNQEQSGALLSEYYENEEAMIRDDAYKLVYITGQRERQDGYKTGLPLPGRTVKLFDVVHDPEEQTNLAGKADQADRVRRMKSALAGQLFSELSESRQEKIAAAAWRAVDASTDYEDALLDLLLVPVEERPQTERWQDALAERDQK